MTKTKRSSKPAVSRFIPQMEPHFGPEEANALKNYMTSGGWVTEFKKTEEFCNLLRAFTGAKHCSIVNNGTVALSAALLAVGVGPGHEVIVPDFTMIATANAAKLIGAEPIFVDVLRSSLMMDPEKLFQAIGSDTKAVIAVSFNGRSEGLGEILNICREKNIPLIEDAAQSLGSYHDGKHLGTLGDVGVFSFSSQKIITTGQGGAVVTQNDSLAKKIRGLKDFGRQSGGADIHDEMGFNFKFTDIQAVVGIEQMKKLKKRIKRKKEIYAKFEQSLKNVGDIEFIPTDLKKTTPWFVDIYVSEPDSLSVFLKENNIGSRRIYPPVHAQRIYDVQNAYPVTEEYSHRGLWLPSSSQLKDSEIDRVCSSVKKYFSQL